MTLAERVARWRTSAKLRRGQCPECGVVLRDDARPRSLCGAEECADAEWAARQW